MLKGSACSVQVQSVFYTEEGKGKYVQNLVLEYLPDSLEDYLQRHIGQDLTVPLTSIRVIMSQVLKALGAIHSKGVCHRDIKPDNILLASDLSVKLGDFGSAKVLDPNNRRNISHTMNRYYRPPEMIFGLNDYSTKVDVWSAGCVLAELFLMKPLFPGKSEATQLFELLMILGTPSKKDKDYLYKNLTDKLKKKLERIEELKPISFTEILPKRYPQSALNLASDLLSKMLAWNPDKRIDAKTAACHPFFNFFPCHYLSLIHICRCRRYAVCRSRWSPYH
eukprot:TRINITY_DN15363_c0_g1_i1.p1 TRINITY_DN15363_c0_g1~~TRINITY_DN15363_c0_g1_i1.p1  ORF type:complete len:279 (+),score=48.70 TRINITY_DN15363_c0_g1_i1:287-1123(+)